MTLEGKKTKIGAIGCFVSGILLISSPFLGIPIETACGLFAISYAIKEWGRYDRDRRSHEESQEMREKTVKESTEILDKAFFRINPLSGKKISRLKKPGVMPPS